MTLCTTNTLHIHTYTVSVSEALHSHFQYIPFSPLLHTQQLSNTINASFQHIEYLVPTLGSSMSSITFLLLPILLVSFGHCHIPSTLEGPFDPITVPFDPALRGNAVDLPETDPRVRRRVRGFEPEQISVSLSTNHDSVWVSWVTGMSCETIIISM